MVSVISDNKNCAIFFFQVSVFPLAIPELRANHDPPTLALTLVCPLSSPVLQQVAWRPHPEELFLTSPTPTPSSSLLWAWVFGQIHSYYHPTKEMAWYLCRWSCWALNSRRAGALLFIFTSSVPGSIFKIFAEPGACHCWFLCLQRQRPSAVDCRRAIVEAPVH